MEFMEFVANLKDALGDGFTFTVKTVPIHGKLIEIVKQCDDETAHCVTLRSVADEVIQASAFDIISMIQNRFVANATP